MEKYFDFYNINRDGSERVNYDLPLLPVYIRRGGLKYFRDYTFKAHFHSDWEFTAVTRGRLKYCVNGVVSTLNENEGIFVNSNRIHYGFSDTKTDCEYICIVFHPSLLCENSYIENNFIVPVLSSLPFFSLSREAVNTVFKINAEKENGSRAFYLKLQGDLFSLAYEIYLKAENAQNEKEPLRDFDAVKAMLGFINENYREQIKLADIAKSGGVCKNGCISVFKKFTGFTPVEYLGRYRLQKACAMLKKTDKTVYEIASECGFSSSSYFCEMFKRSFNATPNEYRQKAV